MPEHFYDEAAIMNVTQTTVDGVLLLEPRAFTDERGFHLESWNARAFAEVVGGNVHFVQDNHSRSAKNVLRGLGYQVKRPQGKLVRVVRGVIFDVVVDLRESSPTFGMWYGVELSEDTHRMLWIPPGCAHGFAVRGDGADVIYKVTDYYAAEYVRCIIWNDPTLSIPWQLTAEPILSPGDRVGVTFEHAETYS